MKRTNDFCTSCLFSLRPRKEKSWWTYSQQNSCYFSFVDLKNVSYHILSINFAESMNHRKGRVIIRSKKKQSNYTEGMAKSCHESWWSSTYVYRSWDKKKVNWTNEQGEFFISLLRLTMKMKLIKWINKRRRVQLVQSILNFDRIKLISFFVYHLTFDDRSCKLEQK